AHRHDLAIRAHRRFGALRGQVLPSLNQRAGDPQLATQLRGCELASQHSIDLLSLEFGREQTPAIRTAGWFHCTLRSLESVSFEGVSLNWGSKQAGQPDCSGSYARGHAAGNLGEDQSNVAMIGKHPTKDLCRARSTTHLVGRPRGGRRMGRLLKDQTLYTSGV